MSEQRTDLFVYLCARAHFARLLNNKQTILSHHDKQRPRTVCRSTEEKKNDPRRRKAQDEVEAFVFMIVIHLLINCFSPNFSRFTHRFCLRLTQPNIIPHLQRKEEYDDGLVPHGHTGQSVTDHLSVSLSVSLPINVVPFGHTIWNFPWSASSPYTSPTLAKQKHCGLLRVW